MRAEARAAAAAEKISPCSERMPSTRFWLTFAASEPRFWYIMDRFQILDTHTDSLSLSLSLQHTHAPMRALARTLRHQSRLKSSPI